MGLSPYMNEGTPGLLAVPSTYLLHRPRRLSDGVVLNHEVHFWILPKFSHPDIFIALARHFLVLEDGVSTDAIACSRELDVADRFALNTCKSENFVTL